MSHRRGFSLTEVLIAIVIVSILVLIAYPKLTNAMVTTNVRGARITIVNMIAKARAVATQSNRRSAQLEFAGNNVFITAAPRAVTLAGSDRDTIGTVQKMRTCPHPGLPGRAPGRPAPPPMLLPSSGRREMREP